MNGDSNDHHRDEGKANVGGNNDNIHGKQHPTTKSVFVGFYYTFTFFISCIISILSNYLLNFKQM